MTKPGSAPKGSVILNKICTNRVPKRHKKVMAKAVAYVKKQETPEQRKERFERLHQAARDRAALAREQKEKEKAASNDADDQKEEVSLDDETSDGEILTKKERNLRDMLMRVVKGFGGERKILAMARKSDSLKVVLIKELLKIESKEMEARLRAKTPQGQGNTGFFFVMKGLEDVKKIESSGFDMKFLGNALSPTEPIDVSSSNEEEEKIEP